MEVEHLTKTNLKVVLQQVVVVELVEQVVMLAVEHKGEQVEQAYHLLLQVPLLLEQVVVEEEL